MESNCVDLTSTGTKRSSIKLTNSRPAKRRRSTSTATSSTGSASMDLAQSSRDSSPPQRKRRVGDGLDCRRPASTTAGSLNNPIDLSSEDDEDDLAIQLPQSRPASRPRQQDRSLHRVQPSSRGPRYSQQIINEIIRIDEGDDTGREEHLRRHQAAPLPDYRHSFHLPSQPPPARQTPAILSHRNVQPLLGHAGRASGPQPPSNAPIVVIDSDEEDDISFIVEDGHGRRMQSFNNNEAAMLRSSMSGRTPVTGVNGAQAHTRAQGLMNRVRSMHLREQPQLPPQAQPQRVPGLGLAGFIAPMMDYGYSAFDFMTGNNRYPEPIRQPTPPPAYPILGDCPAGFTRTPEEGDVLICPNCERELCVEEPTSAAPGSSKKTTLSPTKSAKTKHGDGRDEVWVVKACGHAYCGACARARKAAPKKNARSKLSPKGKGKEKEQTPAPLPLSDCRIKGCGEKLSGKAHMIQLFL